MRVLFSSANLLNHVRRHRSHERLSLAIKDGCCTVLSPEGPSELPVESRHNLITTVDTQRLFMALLSIPDQPITLDLHEWPNAFNTLYAYKRVLHLDKEDELVPIQFDL